jgi:superfamily II RNA helicase
VEIYKRHNAKCNEKDSIYNKIVKTESAIDNSVNCVLDLLEKWNVITKAKNTTSASQNIYQFFTSTVKPESDIYELTLNGHVAKQLREIHCIVFSELIVKNRFKPMTTVELIGVFSCFTNVSVSVEQRSAFPVSKNVDVKNCISEICEMYNVYREIEIKNNIDTGIDYSIQFDLTDYMMEWCDCQNEPECKGLLQKIFEEKGVFLGEFIKAVLKINNISAELEKVAETMCDVEFLDKLKRIPELTMKFVATNQSLYV